MFCKETKIKYQGLSIQIVSDLHLEFLSCKPNIIFHFIQPSASYLAMVGDICLFENDVFLQGLFRYLSQCFKKILYIPGNHEYYQKSKEKKTKECLLEKAKQLTIHTNVIIMDNETITLEGVKIIGTTLWSHVPRIHHSFIQNYSNDYRMIYTEDETNKIRPITVMDTNRWNKESIQFLTEELNKANENKEQVLVLTHHAPIFEHTSSLEYKGSIGTLAFANQLQSLLGSPLHTWVFGHTHWRCDFVHKQTRIISNAYGYQGELKKRTKYKEIIKAYKKKCVIYVPN